MNNDLFDFLIRLVFAVFGLLCQRLRFRLIQTAVDPPAVFLFLACRQSRFFIDLFS